jgi:hypothetical protein
MKKWLFVITLVICSLSTYATAQGDSMGYVPRGDCKGTIYCG